MNTDDQFPAKQFIFALDYHHHPSPRFLIKSLHPTGVTKEQLQKIVIERSRWGNMNGQMEEFISRLETIFKEITGSSIETVRVIDCV